MSLGNSLIGDCKSLVLKCFLSSFLLLVFVSEGLAQQTFSASLPTPVDLSGANGTCAAPGSSPSSFPINVSGVGTLSSSLALLSVTVGFTDCAGSYGLASDDCSFRIMSPSGTCVGIYNGGLSTSFIDGETEFRLVSSEASCLSIPNTAQLPVESAPGFDLDGSSGVFLASWSGVSVNFTSTFNGQNANGTWRVIFSNTTSDNPCIYRISIAFGNPSITNAAGSGDNCVNPIIWNGGPICASTSGMTNSSQMPGWAGPGANTFGTFNGGATCDWNFANNNDVWIKFTAQQSLVCINISGLDASQQTVVVSDPNIDGDNNACTGSGGGQYWNLVSCPDPAIYTTTAGTDNNQNHCFSAIVGQEYFLVIDGNGGAESPFYVSGISGTNYNLPIELVSFTALLNNRIAEVSWQTATEKNNDYFLIERSQNGSEWELLDQVDGSGNSTELLSYRTYDFHPYRGVTYYRLKQVDYDGEYSYSEIRSVYNTDDLMILPNPSTGIFGIGGMPKHQENTIMVLDITGKVLEQHSTEEESYQLGLTHCSAGVYLVIINGTESIKVIKE